MVTRRQFLQVTALSGGGMLVGCSNLPSDSTGGNAASAKTLTPTTIAPSAYSVGTADPAEFGIYVAIHADDRIVVSCPQTEMGQGVLDGLAKIVAEELDADWSRVEVRLPWADDRFVNPLTKRQRTANSESTVIYFDVLRKVGAGTRAQLVAAAAQRWQVSAAECTTRDSLVSHASSGRSARYGELAAAAALLPAVAAPALKNPAQFRLIGTHTPRKDTPAKCDGSAIFGIDVRLPGMLYAALRRSPAVNSTVRKFDREAALALPGVVDAFEIPDGIAVLAADSWRARRAAEAMSVDFDESASSTADDAIIRERMRHAMDDDSNALPGRPAFGGPPYDKARTLAALAAAPQRHEWSYEVPFLAHAALEPLCATAWLRDGECEVWAPTQQPDRARDAMVQITGLPREKCRLNVTFIGGGFGRKFELDFIRQALQIAVHQKGKPVKLTWTREQDFAHDRYRPAHRVRTRVGLSKDGQVLAMHSRSTGVSLWKYQNRPAIPGFGDLFAMGLLINDFYKLGECYVDFVDSDFPIPVGTWRSVSQSMNCFFGESAIDDIAAVTHRDPLALRRQIAAGEPRLLAVMDRAAQESQWQRPLAKGWGRGLALSVGFGAYCAQVVEVSVQRKRVHVERIVCAFDCGTIVDPGNVLAQVEGGIVWGLSAARDGQITFVKGAAVQTNFHTGPVLRMSEMPKIEVHLVRSTAKPGGAGEASVPPVAPALASAIYSATGQRPRRLPLIVDGYQFA